MFVWADLNTMSNTITIRQPGTGGHRSTSGGEISRDFWHLSKKGPSWERRFQGIRSCFFWALKTCFNPKPAFETCTISFFSKNCATSLEVTEVDTSTIRSCIKPKKVNQPHQGTNTRISDPRTKILCGNLKAPPVGKFAVGKWVVFLR